MTDFPLSLTLRAYELHAKQQDVEAVRCLQTALKLEPGLAAAMYLKGLIALAHGNYELGLPLFELRNARTDVCPPALKYRNIKRWDGKPTKQRVLIWAEEWLGGSGWMLRFMPKGRGGWSNLTLGVPAGVGGVLCSN